jgi:hypothetical protein
MAANQQIYSPGSLVRVRERDWVGSLQKKTVLSVFGLSTEITMKLPGCSTFEAKVFKL